MSVERRGSRGVGAEVGKATLPSSTHGTTHADPGRRTLVEHEAASRGVAGAGQPLPYLEQIRRSFGRHDISNVTATIGGDAAASGEQLGADAYAYGDRIAFASPPDLHTAAHEAAHVVQQRAGVSAPHETHEHQADAVADAVVAGQSAEHLLDAHGSGATSVQAPVIQRKAGVGVDAAAFLDVSPTRFNAELRNAIAGIMMVSRGPHGAKLAGSPFEANLVEAIVDEWKAGRLADYYQQFVEPDDIVQLVNRARGHDWDTLFENFPRELRDSGPASETYFPGVAIEIANAIARRYVPAIRRMMERLLERHVRAMTQKAADAPRLPDVPPPDPKTMHREGPLMEYYDLSDLGVSHPVDLAVKYSLADAQQAIDLEGIARSRAELWTRFEPKLIDPLSGTTEVPAAPTDAALRPVTVALKTYDGLHHWVSAETADGKPATREEVALALFEGDGDRDSATRFAHYLIDVAPLFGFTGRAVAHFKTSHRVALMKRASDVMSAAMTTSYPEGEAPAFPADIADGLGLFTLTDIGLSQVSDPMIELTGQRPALAMQRAKLAVSPEPAGKDEVSVVARLTEAIRLCETVQLRIDTFGPNSHNLNAVYENLGRRRTEARTHSIDDVAAQWTLADRQAKILADVAAGFGEIAMRHAAYSASDEDGNNRIDGAAQEVLDDARAPFEAALVALDFPEIAEERAALGTQRAQVLDVSLQEVVLHRGMEEVDTELMREHKTPEVDAPALAKQTTERAHALGATRMKATQDPLAARAEATTEGDKVGILNFDISIGAKLGAIDDLWETIDKQDDFWIGLADKVEGDNLKKESNVLRFEFSTHIYARWVTAKAIDDRKAMNAVREAFAKFLTDQLRPFFTKVNTYVKDTEKNKRWMKLAVGILIAVAAFALGQWEFAFLLQAGAGTAGAAVVAGLTTTLTSMALEKLILNHDPTLGSVIMGFAGNVAVFGIVGKMSMAGRAAGVGAEVGEASVGAAAKLAEGSPIATAATTKGTLRTALEGFAKEIVFGEVFMLVAGEGQSLIDNGRMMTGPEMLECAAMGVVNIIGMKVAHYPFAEAAKMFKAFKGARLEGKADIEGLTAMGESVAALGAELNAEAGGPGHLAKGRAPREKAQALLARWDDYHQKQQQVGEAMQALAEKHPERFKMKLEELKAAKETLDNGLADSAALQRQLRQARAILGVEEIGPGLFRGDPAAMDAILAQHKASQSELLGISTDPVTGQRTLKFRTADGASIEMIEKLADPKQRKAPAMAVAKARHFEAWLEKIDMTTQAGAKQHARLTEYYARDPDAAVHLAETAYEYKPGEAATPELMPGVRGSVPEPASKPGKTAEPSPAEKAWEHYQYTREGKRSSDFGDKWAMRRSDFERWYEAGYEFDPVGERFITRGGEAPPSTRAGSTGAKGPRTFDAAEQNTSVLGDAHSEAVGHELTRMLARGEVGALRVVGIEPPPGFDPRSCEWGLGKQGGKVVLIKGGKGAVDWSMIPGVEDIGHTHPYLDPETGNARALKGHDGKGTLDLGRLKAGDVPSTMFIDLIHLFPSTSDLHFVAIKGAARGGHRVGTSYVSLGNGKIGNPVEGGNHPQIEFTIDSSVPIGVLEKGSEIVVYKAELTVWAADRPIDTLTIYERFHTGASFDLDWITLQKPEGMADLPANHKLSTSTDTPAGKFEARKIGNVDKQTLTSLVHQGLSPPRKGSPIEAALERMSPEQADLLKTVAMSESVNGFEHWIERVSNDPTQVPASLHELERARTTLANDARERVTFDKDGKARWEGDGKDKKLPGPESAEKAKAREEKEANQLEDEAERTKKVFKKAKKEQAASTLIDTVERGLGTKEATGYVKLLRLRPDLDLPAYTKQVAAYLGKTKVAPAQKGPILERSLHPEVADPVQFLEDAMWVADRVTDLDARANLLNSASTGMLDMQWLRTLDKLTAKELDLLGSRKNMAWNQAKIAAEYDRMQRAKAAAGDTTRPKKQAEEAAANANAAVEPQLRGVAGEQVAETMGLTGGFEVGGRGTPEANRMEPDYQASNGKEVADLEVKANQPDYFKADIKRAIDGEPSLGIQRMLRQLEGTKQRGRKSFLAISDGMETNGGKELLKKYLESKGLDVEIVTIKETDIKAAATKLREHLGIRPEKE